MSVQVACSLAEPNLDLDKLFLGYYGTHFHTFKEAWGVARMLEESQKERGFEGVEFFPVGREE